MSVPARVSRGGLLLMALVCVATTFFAGCSHVAHAAHSALVLLIESNPANLDPRFATDAQSQHLDGLIFSSLVARDDQMNLQPDLAESWETPDPLTYIFHLRHGVRFHDGSAVTAADVKATFDYILNAANRSPKRGGFRMIAGVEAANSATVIFHLKEPYASFLWSVSRPAIGIVPAGAGSDFSRILIGSGPFRFVSQAQDDEVVLAANPDYFGGAPSVARLQARIVPDAIVRALELRKGSADLEISSLSPDIVPVLAKRPDLAVTERPGTNLAYLGFNLDDPFIGRREVRQALAFATDRATLIRYLLHGQARIATGILPPNHWAYEPDVAQYSLDTARAGALLDAAGFPRGKDGVRFHLLLKTSTEEQARLVGAVLQEEWRQVGIALEVRPLEFATLLSDSVKGNFQINLLRWVGANNDPDVFEFVFSSRRFPPDGANRGHYRNPRIDALTDQIRVEMDRAKRRALCSEAQKILAVDLPYLPLWFGDAVSVHRKDLGDLALSPSGDLDFLEYVKVQN
ncbi:MAG TPA: ABC transporter substrate-binding protein [Candidatus Acidoferrum sp.]|jgi:peptide/nickel transport system substrate-binding protein